MKSRKKKKKKIIGVVLLCAALSCFFANLNSVGPAIAAAAEQSARLSAMAVMPEGGADFIQKQLDGSATATTNAVVASINPDDNEDEDEDIQTNTPVTTTAKAAVPTTPGTGKVETVNMANVGYSFKYNNVYVSNKTKSHTFDIAKELAKRPDIKIIKKKNPQVLIMHTHATESYLSTDNGQYSKSYSGRTTDNSKNMVRVGEEIKKQLDAAGIVTIHDPTQHDYPSYNGGYERSAVTINKYLKKYPSIDVVLDIHRDAITRSDGTKIKPTAVIGGKKAAQIMICAGCEDNHVTGFSDWEYNLRFALRIQQQCATSYPGLARPMYFVGKKYNEHLSRGSLLIEMGSDSNTLSEAIYSGELLGKSLVKVLNSLTK